MLLLNTGDESADAVLKQIYLECVQIPMIQLTEPERRAQLFQEK